MSGRHEVFVKYGWVFLSGMGGFFLSGMGGVYVRGVFVPGDFVQWGFCPYLKVDTRTAL